MRFALFNVLFLSLDYVYLFSDYFSNDYESLTIAIMDNSVGYNNLFYIAGIVATVIFIIDINHIISIGNSALVVRKGKSGCIRYFLFKVLIEAMLISIEFVGAEALICSIRFKSQLLFDTNFYQCCILYAVSLLGYFAVVGTTEVLIYVLLNFNKVSSIIVIAMFVGLNSLILCGLDISPIYYSMFISEWFQQNSFNVIEYAFDLLKCICIVLVNFYLSNIIFHRKDLIFNEQKD